MPMGDTNKSLGPLAIAGVEPYQAKPGEEYMNEAQKTHFRKILEAWFGVNQPDTAAAAASQPKQ